MKEYPSVSIIIPVKNPGKIIERVLYTGIQWLCGNYND